ncbi:peptide MFS transporter [Corynebacterium falsenii]|uniref:peptide MFS transporter n=1 Tax=Corynebacterium falsenii TaxID=108486 RepID=UPI0004AFA14F|nr:oligopeptide:H+ symporter [Corynebacterium falsenii]MDC7103306.1 oligopeptide:H+ symporter [Corynebacterium falsenii]UBI04050.1 oligopeptide:H+ symporter [Corynebacterium falsenii]UBI05935.1 oligopeptide:H+ symporter [Corynebacterium falsenii]HJF12627.1 oligopeptide:H+ symporter [Corynebacterium falsenii]
MTSAHHTDTPPSSARSGSAPASQAQSRSFFGHPWGLANLSGIEMWERFSYYGLQALLLFYLYYSVNEGGLGLDKPTAVSIVGAYGGLMYLTSVAGAWVADRILSAERTMYFSAILVMIGHLSLAFIPGFTGLTIGLVSVSCGAGALKTTSQVVLGNLYDRDDPRRDGGFSIYFMGIYIGALLGPLITNALWGWKGFHWGFAAAAVLMAIGLIQYTIMRKGTIAAAGQDVADPLSPRRYVLIILATAAVVAVFVSLFASGVLKLSQLSDIAAMIAILVAVVLWLEMYRSPRTTAKERSRLIGFIPMFAASVAFWSVFLQQFTVIALYSDERLDRNLFGIELPPGVVQSINPLFIILLGAVFSTVWTKLGDKQPSYATKFALALGIIGAAVLIFIPFAGGGANSTPMWALVIILALFTIGELLIGPVGNSMVTRLAPEAFPTRMFALWLISVSAGSSLSGTFAGFYHPEDGAAERTYFLILSVVMIALCGLMLLARRWVVRKFVDVR